MRAAHHHASKSKQLGTAVALVALVALAKLCAPSLARAECKPGPALTAGDHAYDLEHEGKVRTFIVHVPPGYDGNKPMPVVLDLHGFSSNGLQQLWISGFSAVADANGFILVAPDGYMSSWNGDIAFGAAYEEQLDDVGLLKAIVEFVASIANTDRGRVYATGLSNGAAMSNTLGCQAADTFAAVAPVADPLDIGLDTCEPVRPISVIGFHGYDDEYVPYEGGQGSGPPLPDPFPSIPDTLSNWARIMQCTGAAEVMMLSGTSKCEIYRSCGGAAQVGYCSLAGAHLLYDQSVLDIADYAWRFFENVSLPLPDVDGDGIGDEDDNCAQVANADQLDVNDNCIGDVCECGTATDCDDGAFCTGTEACSAGVCERGPAPCAEDQVCDDALAQCVDGTTAPSGGTSGTSAGSSGGATPGAAGASGSTAGADGANPGAPHSGASGGGGGGEQPASGSGASAHAAGSNGSGCAVSPRPAACAPAVAASLLLLVGARLARRRRSSACLAARVQRATTPR